VQIQAVTEYSRHRTETNTCNIQKG